AEARHNLGGALRELGQWDEAVECYRQALALQPNYVDAHLNLGIVLREQGRLDEAVASYRRALALRPPYAAAHNNLGNARRDLGKVDEAVASLEKALALKPDYAEAHFTRALIWLLMGDWERGWPEYEWRWRTKEFTPRLFPQPLWHGEPVPGKTIL